MPIFIPASAALILYSQHDETPPQEASFPAAKRRQAVRTPDRIIIDPKNGFTLYDRAQYNQENRAAQERLRTIEQVGLPWSTAAG